MAETQTIIIGSQKHEVVLKPINLIFSSCHASMGPDYQYPGRVVLDNTVTVYHAERVQKLHADFEQYWRLFFRATSPVVDVKYPITADEIRKMGMGARHLMGLIDMQLKFMDLKKPTVWRHPESYMHPGWAVGLGDLIIQLQLRGQS